MDVLAFRIPYTKRHVRFLEETTALLDVLQIQYRTAVIVHYEEQWSEVGFYFVDERCAQIGATLCKITSMKLVSREALGLKP